MRPLVLGVVLGVLWLVFGFPLAAASTVLAPLLQPVTVAFAAGILARPYLARRGWTR